MNTYETQKERQLLLNSGSVELSPNEIKTALSALGYEIDTALSFNYLNSANEFTYNARSIRIRHKGTKKGFANIEAPRDSNFKLLQELRGNSHGYANGRIYEF
jgi:hypothetical protein